MLSHGNMDTSVYENMRKLFIGHWQEDKKNSLNTANKEPVLNGNIENVNNTSHVNWILGEWWWFPNTNRQEWVTHP